MRDAITLLITYGHGELVVWEQPRHQVEEVLIVLAEDDGLERDLPEDRFQPRRELALDVPVLLCYCLLEDPDRLFQLWMEWSQ